MILSDSCFSMGTSHAVCQDYACSDQNTAAVSDGCSSSPHTDMGARALAVSAINLLQQQVGRRAFLHSADLASAIMVKPDRDPFGDLVISGAENIIKAFPQIMGISRNSLDATLAVIAVTSETSVPIAHGFLWGDGLIVHRDKAGTLNVLHQEYASGAPYYLSYRLSRTRMEAYAAQYDNALVESRRRFVPEEFASAPPSEHPRHYSEARYFRFQMAPGETVLACTDGINQFVREGSPVPWIEVITQICDFKRLSGAFLKSRMNFFGRECRKSGTTHGDDFAVVALHNDGLETESTN